MYARAEQRSRGIAPSNTNSQPTIVPLVGYPSQSNSKTQAGWLGFRISVPGEAMYFNLGTDRHNMVGIVADMYRDGYISTVGLSFASVATRVRTHDNSLRSARRSSGRRC